MFFSILAIFEIECPFEYDDLIRFSKQTLFVMYKLVLILFPRNLNYVHLLVYYYIQRNATFYFMRNSNHYQWYSWYGIFFRFKIMTWVCQLFNFKFDFKVLGLFWAFFKAELLQLNRTQFPSLGIFGSKKVGNWKN